MSGRSSNQVNNLRAMFEQNKESSSPPSRGRSPAGLESIADNNLRPLSKVRTSFVAVGRSGQMGPSLEEQKSNQNGESTTGGDGSTESKSNENGTTLELSKSHSNGIAPERSEANIEKKVSKEDGKDADKNSNAEAPVHDSSKLPLDNHADASLGEPVAESKDENQTVQFPGSEERVGETEETEAEKTTEDSGDLGIVMKGASFEQDGEAQSVSSGETKAKPLEHNPSSPKRSQPINVLKTSGPIKDQTATKPSTMPKEKPSSRPSASSTKRGFPSVSTVTGAPAGGPLKKSPRTPTSPIVASRQPSSKTTSPRQPFSSKVSSNTSKELTKVPAQRPGRTSGGAKGQATTITKAGQTASSNGNPAKRLNQTSPNTKLRPKSPTRPVRLPAGATAPTASSVAKLGDIPPSRSPSRASVANTARSSTLHGERPAAISRDPVPGTGANLRKSSRPSLPAASTTNQKQKARLSTSGSKVSEGSFLARMMRPTQSSASKTHEKVEHGSPPSKSNVLRSKRKSNAADEEKRSTAGESGPTPAHEGDAQSNTPIVENAEDTPVENGIASADVSPTDATSAQ